MNFAIQPASRLQKFLAILVLCLTFVLGTSMVRQYRDSRDVNLAQIIQLSDSISDIETLVARRVILSDGKIYIVIREK